jgi:hypothetical protein
MKKHLVFLVVLLTALGVAGADVFAASSGLVLNRAYPKSDGTYTVTVKDTSRTDLGLYVNDTKPTYATTDSKNWATFRGVKLTGGTGKISFTRVYKNGSKTAQKPVNYVRYYSVTGSQVRFQATNPAKATAPKVEAAQTPAPVQSTPTVSAPSTVTAAPTPQPAPQPSPQPVCANGSYVNSVGNTVCSPQAAPSAPAGATAKCRDGTYSFSQSRSGTCSHHGGVSEWL